MHIKFLGTSAAEGIPALFCGCDICEKSRSAGGKNIRTRSQAIVFADASGPRTPDDMLLIDFGPDTHSHAIHNNLRMEDIAHLLITHSHRDHFLPVELNYRSPAYSRSAPAHELTVYANEIVADAIAGAIYKDAAGVRVQVVRDFEVFRAGSFVVTAIPAAHDTRERCLIYKIEHGAKSLLYATDTGVLGDDAIAALGRVDFAALDGTWGRFSRGPTHMGLPDAIALRTRLLEAGCMLPGAACVLTHISHHGGATHDELCAIAAEHGFGVAHDGGLWAV